jgi:hypothetical protein
MIFSSHQRPLPTSIQEYWFCFWISCENLVKPFNRPKLDLLPFLYCFSECHAQVLEIFLLFFYCRMACILVIFLILYIILLIRESLVGTAIEEIFLKILPKPHTIFRSVTLCPLGLFSLFALINRSVTLKFCHDRKFWWFFWFFEILFLD